MLPIPRRYQNFRDPLGLVVRMLRSGNRAAYASLTRAAMEPLVRPLDRSLRPLERSLLASAGPPAHPVLLIVGPPRSGTTLLYQLLAQALPVTYFNNLSALFPESPLAASFLLNRFLRPPAGVAENFYGNTAALPDPNDGFHVWNRWLGDDRYHVPTALDGRALADLRTFFRAWTAVFDRPFLNKNNRNLACIPLLASALEEAVFIVVERDPIYVAQSLIRAREVIQGSRDRGWGLLSRERVEGRDPLAYVDDVSHQIRAIQQCVDEAVERVGPDRFVFVSYEALCADPPAVVEALARRTLGDAPIDHAALRRFEVRPSRRLYLTRAERARLEAGLGGLERAAGYRQVSTNSPSPSP